MEFMAERLFMAFTSYGVYGQAFVATTSTCVRENLILMFTFAGTCGLAEMNEDTMTLTRQCHIFRQSDGQGMYLRHTKWQKRRANGC